MSRTRWRTHKGSLTPALGSRSRPSRQGQRRRFLLTFGFGTGAVPLAVVLVWGAEPTRVSGSTGVDPEIAEQVVLGERLYAEHCASCQGGGLEGQPNWRSRLPDGRYPAPPHDATGHTWHHGDAYLFETTKRDATAPRGFVSGMPAFGGTLTDAEIRSILAFIKSRWPPEICSRQMRAHR